MSITGPLFKYFGSKWKSSKFLPYPIHDTIIEPFAGSAGYSLRHCEKNIILYEKHQRTYDLWKWLIEDATEKDILNTPLGTDLPEGFDIRLLDLDEGHKLFVKYWQYTNNISGCWKVSYWARQGQGGYLSKKNKK